MNDFVNEIWQYLTPIFKFIEGLIAYISGPTVAALIVGVLGKAYYDHWLANRRTTREQKLTEESEARARNIARQSVAIDDIGIRFRDWMAQYENIKNMDQPLERLEIMQASSYGESVSRLSFASRNVSSIIEPNETIFSNKDYEQLRKLAQEIVKSSKAIEDSLGNYDVGRSMSDQPELLSRSRDALRQLIQDVNRTVLPMHQALIARFRELNGTSKN